jgi:hypothetical protein
MKTMTKTNSIALALTFSMAAAGCLETDEPIEGDPGGELTQHQAISDCGGFEVTEGGGDGDYCAAERLEWSFDAAAGTLELTDSRVVANCCGDRSIEVELVDGVYVVTESDLPEGGDGRCRCMCVFDFALTIEGLGSGAIPVRLERDTPDDSGLEVLWEGTLDLGAGSGSEVLDPRPEDSFC